VGTVYIEWRDASGAPTGLYAYPGVSLFDWNQLANAASIGQEANRLKRRPGGGVLRVA